MPRKFKFLDQPEHLRRRQALAEGMRHQYFVCPMCGLNRAISRGGKGRIRFDKVDLKKGFILQERAGGGRILGWYRDDDASFTLPELKKKPEYQDLLDQIMKRCHEIIRALV